MNLGEPKKYFYLQPYNEADLLVKIEAEQKKIIT